MLLRRWIATYEYIEIVGGEPREFVHETIIEASDKDAAMERAQRHFHELTLQSGTGWTRVLNRYRVVATIADTISAGAAPMYAKGAGESD